MIDSLCVFIRTNLTLSTPYPFRTLPVNSYALSGVA